VTTIVSFVVVIGVLILIHELGHFFVARLAGVGVERFSIGFGPVLLRWRGKETEYCLSAIPMGGYVKMVGEENPLEGGGSPIYDRDKAFAFKALWARFLIVFAGPGMNFVLAAMIFSGLAMLAGRPVSPPVLGLVTDDGPAAQAGLETGDRVLVFGDRRIASWEDLAVAVAASDGRPVDVRARRGDEERAFTVTPRRATVRDLFDDPREVWDIGAGPLLTPHVTAVTPRSPAERAGFEAGDVVIAVAGKPVYSPDELTQAIKRRPDQQFPILVKRGGRELTLTVAAERVPEKTPAGKENEVGRIGVGIGTDVAVSYVRSGPLSAIGEGIAQTWNMTVLTTTGLWKLLTRQLDLSNIGGPIQIATEAGRQARQGIPALAVFTAVISVNLAVLNLLPVPMLDGGHLLFFLVEAIRGRPLSLKKREAAQQVGFVLLMLLMVYALYNDLTRIDAFRFLR
jgi:regulator of sigma E protease